MNEFSWSYGKLRNFETCPLRYLHYDVLKDVKEPESEALRAGSAMHAAFEARIKHGTSLPLGMGMHEQLLAKLADAPGQIHVEQKLAIDDTFRPATFFSNRAWFRSVLDYTLIKDDHTASVVDFKSGKPNPDFTQLQLYAATIFHHEPKIERVRSALLFVSYDTTERAEYVREDLPEIWGEILPRVKLMQEARDAQAYPPRPSGLCKRYCAVKTCVHCGR
jgi:hypothetical protein